MTGESRLSLNRNVAAIAALGLLLSGAAAAYVGLRLGRTGGDSGPTMPAGAAERSTPAVASGSGATSATTAADAPLPDVQVTLSEDATQRAGIVVEPVARGTSSLELRLPAVVEPNAYRQVVVTPLVGGRVTHVSAELGDRVRRGATMAQIYSPPLAEAQTRYVSVRAMLEAHDRELQRTEKLVEIGSASRQELERIHAEHAAQTAAVQAARAELELLGLPASAIAALDSETAVGATSHVPAPLDGVVTERTANIGLNVDPTTKLFTVIDLASVWVVGELYERDFSRVRAGSGAVVTTPAYPDLTLRGRVSYIDPQVNPATRTARLRVEVPNPRGELRLGMYADVTITAESASSTALVPRAAIQNVGSRTVVYLANLKEPGRFTEREVSLGAGAGDSVEVTGGVQPGDLVVTDGSFALRAERERLGLRRGSSAASSSSAPAEGAAPPEDAVQSARVAVTEQGFQPARVTLRAGVPARLIVTRNTDNTCGTEVVVPSLGVKRALPLNTPVTIEFTPAKAGDIAFACGMNMLKGVMVVQ
jgi:RND family efflux transporter MFP subunit